MSRATPGDDDRTPVPRARPTVRWLRGLLVAVVLVGGAVALTAIAGAGAFARSQEAASEPDWLDDGALIQQGEDLFGARCALCHGEAGRGVSREVAPQAWAPSLIGVGPASVDFMIRTGRMPLENSNERLQHRPQVFTERERQALVAYVANLAPGEGPGIPDIEGYEDAELAVGLELFTSNCAACHGPTAAGIAVGQQDVSSTLDVATPLEVAEAIRSGPGVMPVFGTDVLDEEELEAVVAWVVHLRDREAPGGAQVGRSGPVWEGLVAWVVGLGLLTIVMYLLGEKAGDHDAEPNA